MGVGFDLIYRCEGGHQAAPWKMTTMGREVVSMSCGFWFGVMGLLMGLLVAVMVEVSFLSFFFSAVVGALVVVSGCGGCGQMWWFLSAVIFFSFFVSGGCGMGGGFLVGTPAVF